MKETFVFTTDDLRRLFIEYNEHYFGGSLQTPRFRLVRWFGGIYAGYRRDNDGHPLITFCDAKKVGWTEEFFKTTLLHEMIHQYLDKCRILFIDNCFHLLAWNIVRLYLQVRYGLKIWAWPPKKKKRPKKLSRSAV